LAQGPRRARSMAAARRVCACARALVPWLFLLAVGQKGYYDTLELSSSATLADVKKSYRRLALQWHPDKNSSPEAAERFRSITEAYEVLSDPQRRQEYDSAGGQGFDIPGFSFHDADDIFKAFFGGDDVFSAASRVELNIGGIDDLFSSFFQADPINSFFSGGTDTPSGFGSTNGLFPGGMGMGVDFGFDGFTSRPTWEVGSENTVDGCLDARIRKDVEPRDDTVKHASGSECCNSAPQTRPTDLLGCCQRCLRSSDCEVFNWQPSTGTCWLLYYVGSSHATTHVPDRNMGERPGLIAASSFGHRRSF